MPGEGAVNYLHPVTDPRAFPSAFFVWQVDGAVTLAGAQRVDDFVGHMHGLVVADPDQPDHARALLHAVPLQLDASEAVAGEVRRLVLDATAPAYQMPADPRQVHFEAKLLEEVLRHPLAVWVKLRLRPIKPSSPHFAMRKWR